MVRVLMLPAVVRVGPNMLDECYTAPPECGKRDLHWLLPGTDCTATA